MICFHFGKSCLALQFAYVAMTAQFVLSTIDHCPRRVDNLSTMDKLPDRTTEAELLKAALAASEAAFGLHWTLLKKPAGRQAKNPDAVLELRHAGKTLKYAAEVIRRLRPATLGVIIHQLAAHGDRDSWSLTT